MVMGIEDLRNLRVPTSLQGAMERFCRFTVAVALLIHGVAGAQTGPAGVGSSSTNVLWLGADHGTFSNAGTTPATNGQNVQQWNDRSGNGRHAIQVTTANRPNWHSNQLNGYPLMRYSAANNDRMLSTGLSSAGVASVFVVARFTSLPSPNPGLLQGTPAGNGYTADAAQKSIGQWVSSSSSRPWGRGVQSDGTQRNISETTALAANQTYLISSIYNGTAIPQYVNNAAAGTVNYNGTLRSWTEMSIGCQHGSESWNGDIAEVIIYNTAVNQVQRILISNYLSAKYGFTLTENDVFLQDAPAQGNYDHDVAGIGRISLSVTHTDARGSGIVRISNPTGLGNNEFLMWGHDNGMLGAWGVGDLPAALQGRLERVWRVSERNTTGTAAVDVGAVDITFDLAGMGNVAPNHLRLLVDADQDGSFADEVPLEGAWHVGGTEYRFSAVTSLSDGVRFTLGTTNLAITPLPVDLLRFSAEMLPAGDVGLSWATASERNAALFHVQHSMDLAAWRTVATIDAQGNSNTLVEYAAQHEGPGAGVNYYRLLQMDHDGSMDLSHVVAVEKRAGPVRTVVYPNPSTDRSWLAGLENKEGTLAVWYFDASGRLLREVFLPLAENVRPELDLQGLPPGDLRVVMEHEGVRWVHRLVKLP